MTKQDAKKEEIARRVAKCGKKALEHFAVHTLMLVNPSTRQKALKQLEHNTMVDKQQRVMAQAESLGMCRKD